MRITPLLLLGLAAGCGGEAENPDDGDALAEFDPSVVVYADGCGPVPEARACVEAHPVEFAPGDWPSISSQCVLLGYDCCDTANWISPDAASCIADQDNRFSDVRANTVTMSCYPNMAAGMEGPAYNVYEQLNGGNGLMGVGVNAATGRIAWFDDGTGSFT
ncbi:MAG: hypothetical protein KTR31_25175 [Myxococcales bacterium]|nr:hypothetical protein [Myxococcales bacterium]